MANPSHDNRMHSSSALREKNMISREFNLYLHAGHSIPVVINVNQYDRGEQWLFTLFNADGTQYVPSSGAIVGIKSDNLGIINSGTVDASGRVVINETQQMTAAVGKAVFELVIDDGTHGTANFVVLVEPKPGDNADLSESDISMIEQAIEAASTIKPYGSPLVASTVAGMTDHEKVYVYVGSETGYTSGNWYYWNGSAWASGGVYNSVAVQTDTTLAISGMAADAKKTGDEISDLKSQITNLESIPHEVKLAMDSLFASIPSLSESAQGAYATFHAWASSVVLVSISAVFEQGAHVIYDNASLDDLKQYLTVTASYDDGSSSAVSDYVLSGTLTVGTSTITVTYGDMTDTFTVTVTDSEVDISALFSFTEGGSIRTDNGNATTTSSSTVAYSDYVNISNYQSLEITMRKLRSNPNVSTGLAFYNSSKTFVSGSGVAEHVDTTMESITQETRTLTIPSTAVYVRTTWFGSGSGFYPSAVFSCIGTVK